MTLIPRTLISRKYSLICFSFMLFADFPIPGVTHLEIIEAGLQVLENDVIGPVTVESIRLMKNQITSIEEDAFR
jgi:hypothetical protein